MTRPTGRRGQMVLLAAVVAAVALIPMALAYLQLGAHPDVTAAGEADGADAATVRALDRAVANASSSVSGEYGWDERTAALRAFDDALAGDVGAIERSRLRDSVAIDVTRNDTAAAAWAARNCPSGPNRQFGDCAVHDGVVTQDRVGEVHVLAVAFDVTVTRPGGTSRLTVVSTVL